MLDERLVADQGSFYMPAIQALVRLPMEQTRRDRRRGLRTGGFVSGYPGSPLAGYDLALAKVPSMLDEHDIVLQPAGNEEQAATALMGTQMLDRYEQSRFDGVVGFWYGKGPGLDRAGDAIRHGNFAGTSQHGAVVILSGEDHEATSSTMPHQQDYELMAAGIPILYPSDVGDIRRLGLHAVEMSRYTGCWVSLKLLSALCDSGATISISPDDVPIEIPDLEVDGRPFQKRSDFTFFPGTNIDLEAHLYYERHAAVRAYARANHLDREWWSSPEDTIGIITAGKSAADLRQVLLDAGIDIDDMNQAGIRILQLGLVWPADHQRIQEFCRGLDAVFVIEEKRDVIESQVKQALQEAGQGVPVLGKIGSDGRRLFPLQGGFGPDIILDRLAPVLQQRLNGHAGLSREIDRVRRRTGRRVLQLAPRTPNYCSGCPHSSSTVLSDGQIAWGSPGCHAFATTIEQGHRQINTMTQLGGEGLPWIGLAPFTDRKHIVQNVGDGSLYHSSYSNIRWAVEAGVNITFKVLWNGFVANTGAQELVGGRGVPNLVRQLAADGVRRIVLVTKEPNGYKREGLTEVCEMRGPSEVANVSRELAEVSGTTVMIYDESCANERRRRRKRGKLELAQDFVLINEEVCEACGDCGQKSNCMSLQQVPTELGPKTQIHRSSCNQDYSCIQGECPSFVTVVTEDGTGYRRIDPPGVELAELSEPVRPSLDGPFRVYIPGVGGTGVITLNAMLAVAAHSDGLEALTYDQTGAAQKWGAVLSSLTLLPTAGLGASSRVGRGQADLYLALDNISAVSDGNIDRASPERTAVVLNTDVFPTGAIVRNPQSSVSVPGITQTLAARALTVHTVPARTIAEKLFDDWMLTNIVALGAAFQSGLVPISAASIEAAIELNGVAVERNRKAFRYGRLWVADPERVEAMISPPIPSAEEEIATRASDLGRRGAAYTQLLSPTLELDEELRRVVAIRTARLIDYQGVAYASRYVDLLMATVNAEQGVAPGRHDLANAVAHYLYKVMAYKDEYEVARLLTSERFERQIRETFEAPVKIQYNLQPPAFRRFREGKVRTPQAFRYVLRLLAMGKRLRGTPIDPFAQQRSRREEREIRDWYIALVTEAIERLDSATYARAVELAKLPDGIRGYEQVKSESYAAVRANVLAR